MNLWVSSRNSFSEDFWVGSDSVLLDYFWVNRDCVGWRIHSSPVKAVSGAISEWAATQISLTVSESTGLCALTNQCVTCESSFGGYFLVGSDLVFLDFFWVNSGCVGWRIHASPLEAILVMISEEAATRFSLTLYVSTGAVCDDESIRQL
jgi:hypothetical protein